MAVETQIGCLLLLVVLGALLTLMPAPALNWPRMWKPGKPPHAYCTAGYHHMGQPHRPWVCTAWTPPENIGKPDPDAKSPTETQP